MKHTSDYTGFRNENYRVNTDKDDRHVCVCIMQSSFMWTTINYRSTAHWISKPNFIERIMKITYTDKIKKIQKQLQKMCDKLNTERQLVDKIAYDVQDL